MKSQLSKKERQKIATAKWRAKNAERHAAQKAAWKAANPGKCLQYQRAKYAKDPAKYREMMRENRRKNPLAYFRQQLKKFGITPDQFDEMLAAQGGLCAICMTDVPGGQGRFHVDHDHKTNKVRGILCHRCNTGLGLFRDSPLLLQYAALYLQERS